MPLFKFTSHVLHDFLMLISHVLMMIYGYLTVIDGCISMCDILIYIYIYLFIYIVSWRKNVHEVGALLRQKLMNQ